MAIEERQDQRLRELQIQYKLLTPSSRTSPDHNPIFERVTEARSKDLELRFGIVVNRIG